MIRRILATLATLALLAAPVALTVGHADAATGCTLGTFFVNGTVRGGFAVCTDLYQAPNGSPGSERLQVKLVCSVNHNLVYLGNIAYNDNERSEAVCPVGQVWYSVTYTITVEHF